MSEQDHPEMNYEDLGHNYGHTDHYYQSMSIEEVTFDKSIPDQHNYESLTQIYDEESLAKFNYGVLDTQVYDEVSATEDNRAGLEQETHVYEDVGLARYETVETKTLFHDEVKTANNSDVTMATERQVYGDVNSAKDCNVALVPATQVYDDVSSAEHMYMVLVPETQVYDEASAEDHGDGASKTDIQVYDEVSAEDHDDGASKTDKRVYDELSAVNHEDVASKTDTGVYDELSAVNHEDVASKTDTGVYDELSAVNHEDVVSKTDIRVYDELSAVNHEDVASKTVLQVYDEVSAVEHKFEALAISKQFNHDGRLTGQNYEPLVTETQRFKDRNTLGHDIVYEALLNEEQLYDEVSSVAKQYKGSISEDRNPSPRVEVSPISVLPTDYSKKLKLRRRSFYYLLFEADRLVILDKWKSKELFSWTFTCIRRFQTDKSKNRFGFEAGRSSTYGAGILNFKVKDNFEQLVEKVYGRLGISQKQKCAAC